MHKNYHIFTFSPSCYALVMCQNVNPVTLSNKNDTARVLNTLLVKTLKVVGCVTQKELSLHSFFLNFQSKCSFKQMFREKHYHMTLSIETPPRTFSEICSFLFSFSGQLFHKTVRKSLKTGKTQNCM